MVRGMSYGYWEKVFSLGNFFKFLIVDVIVIVGVRVLFVNKVVLLINVMKINYLVW